MSILDMVLISSKSIGDITIGVSIEEVASDELMITENPVENGASVTDHAFKRPAEIVMKCGWSNSDYSALFGSDRVQLNDGSETNSDYVGGVYSRLLALQQSRKPFDVVTSRRKYANMLLQGLSVITDAKTSAALMVTATMRQIIIVQTRVTTLPPKENQANPKSTAEKIISGVKSALPAIPSPGGAIASLVG